MEIYCKFLQKRKLFLLLRQERIYSAKYIILADSRK